MNANDKTQITDRLKNDKAKGFEDYMNKPETKLMVSMVPPCDNPDLLKTLLRGAYEAGHAGGQAGILMEMITSMVTKPKPDPRDPY